MGICHAKSQNDHVNRVWMQPTLASNIGTGGLNVPGLQATGLIGIQIINTVKVSIIYFYFSALF